MKIRPDYFEVSLTGIGLSLLDYVAERHPGGNGITEGVIFTATTRGRNLVCSGKWSEENPADAIIAQAGNILVIRSSE